MNTQNNLQRQSLETWYFRKTGKYLNLDNPQTFNEKIQWLKLYNSIPIKTLLADKYLVRKWIEDKKEIFPCISFPIYQGYHMILKYVVDGVEKQDEE